MRVMVPAAVGMQAEPLSAVQLPMWGYPTRGAYYRDASSVDAVLAVRVPLFAINAEDDPVSRLSTALRSLTNEDMKISHYEALPFEEFQNNPYTVLCTTSCGGHIGWFESGEQRWFTKPVHAPRRELNEEEKGIKHSLEINNTSRSSRS